MQVGSEGITFLHNLSFRNGGLSLSNLQNVEEVGSVVVKSMHTEDRGKKKELFSQNAFPHRPKDINIQAGPHFKALVNYASQADCLV